MIRRIFIVLAAVVAVATMTSRSEAEPMRILVAVGHRSGLVGERPLKHATRDASRVGDVFVRLGGVRPEHATVLHEPTSAQLFAALDRAAGAARGRAKEDVSLVFYFSGHGDRDAIHLGGERVPLRELDARLSTVPAALRIVVADACRTADTRGKGVSDTEPFAIMLDGRRDAFGVVRVHASADGEIAQESDELGGAIFTHYWLSGLAGAADANGDGRVTFEESYAFAYGQTLFRSARSSGVVQRPALETNLREGAPIVLTQTATTSALRFPQTVDGHYVVYAVGTRTVAGELWTSPARQVALAMPPGRYIVHRRAGGRSAALQLDLGKNEQRDVRASDFQDIPEEVLARKGGEVVLHPDEISAGYAAKTSRLYDLGHEVGVRYAHAWDSFALGAGAIAGFGDLARPTQDASLTTVGVEATAELRARVLGVVLRAGVGPRATALLQTITQADADRLRLAGYEPERRYRAFAWGAHALAGVRIPLGRLFADVDGRGELLGVSLAGSLTTAWSAGASAALGISF